MNEESLITDMDGTIFDARKKKAKALSETFSEEITPEMLKNIRTGYFLSRMTRTQLENYTRILESYKYLSLDEPIEGAIETLCNLRGELKIVYLTGRHTEGELSMKEGTISSLENYGFPLPNEKDVFLIMKPKFRMLNTDFKKRAIREIILPLGIVLAGVGEHPEDSEVYSDSNITPVILYGELQSMRPKSEYKGSPIFLQNWKEIGEWAMARL